MGKIKGILFPSSEVIIYLWLLALIKQAGVVQGYGGSRMSEQKPWCHVGRQRGQKWSTIHEQVKAGIVLEGLFQS